MQLHGAGFMMVDAVDTGFDNADFGGTANVVDCSFTTCGFNGAIFNNLDMNDILFDRHAPATRHPPSSARPAAHLRLPPRPRTPARAAPRARAIPLHAPLVWVAGATSAAR